MSYAAVLHGFRQLWRECDGREPTGPLSSQQVVGTRSESQPGSRSKPKSGVRQPAILPDSRSPHYHYLQRSAAMTCA